MKRIGLILFVIVCFISKGEGKQPYHATVVVGTDSATVSAPNLLDLKRDLSAPNIQELIPSYTPVSEAGIGFNLRGVRAIAGFAAGSTTLNVILPNINVARSFTGSTREESLGLFKEFIKDTGNRQGLLRAYAKYSPIDVIAGNPNSLMTQMGLADYALGRLSPLAGCGCYGAQSFIHQFQVGVNAGRTFADKYDTTVVRMPLRYSYSPDGNSALILDAPFTYLRNGGASSIIASLAVGYRYPVTEYWSLTPILRGGSGGSLDLATSGDFASFGITSVLNFKFSDYLIAITNYVGYITSANLWLTGVNFNYHLQNYVFNNGVDIISCEGFSLCNRTYHLGVSFLDSYFARDHLFIRHFDEVGVSLSTFNILPWNCEDALVLKLLYQFGNREYRGYFVNVDYQF